MDVYVYFLHEAQDATPSFEIALFDKLDRALEHGRKLLAERRRYTAVEVTREDATIARLTQEALREEVQAVPPAPRLRQQRRRVPPAR